MSKGGAAGRGRGRGRRPSLWGGRGKRPGGGAAVPDLSAGTLQMIRMSTGHMEGTLQLLYVLLTDCYVYLLRKGATEKPYLVEEAVSYNELDYVSVS